MKDQLISFETAKLAKEKKYIAQSDNNDYYHYYNEKGYRRYSNDLYHKGLQSVNLISAPTQSLLSKWLREVHNIKLVIDYHVANEKYFYRIIKQKHIDNAFLFETYEKTLEKALQKALKLIK